MEPTAAVAAEVSCSHCQAPRTGTIDELFRSGWTWYSDATQRYFWCPSCAKTHAKLLREMRKQAIVAQQLANVDPNREAKLKARAEEAERQASRG